MKIEIGNVNTDTDVDTEVYVDADVYVYVYVYVDVTFMVTRVLNGGLLNAACADI
jgi:hypothetical protein